MKFEVYQNIDDGSKADGHLFHEFVEADEMLLKSGYIHFFKEQKLVGLYNATHVFDATVQGVAGEDEEDECTSI